LQDIGWTLPLYNPDAVKVTFNANGGSGNMASQNFIKDVEQTLKANTFTKTGYSFKNWNTLQNGTGTSYQDKGTIIVSENTTLFAQWDANVYTLTFQPNGGTVTPTSKSVIYDLPVGALPIPERTGYTFREWRINTTVIKEETIWNYSQNSTATAIWIANTHTITASATTGGTISPAGAIIVLEGGDKAFTITPADGNRLLDVFVDDKSVGAVNEYEFQNVVAAHSIHAVFDAVDVGENKYAPTVQITPNPTTGKLRIENGELKMENIVIFDVYGRKLPSYISSHTSHPSSLNLDISHLSAGIYFLKIETEKEIITRRVIKN
jgi:hypothetical protein